MLVTLELAATAVLVTTNVTLPGQPSAECQQTNGFILCLEDPASWSSEDDDGFDWQQYLSEDDSDRPSDYYGIVDRLYRDILGRAPDEEGLKTWANQLADGKPLYEVREAIARSPEAIEQINQIYREVLGRDADAEGLETWMHKLERGATLQEVRRAIELSEEAAQRRERFGN
jgi:hypothetical protein